MSSLASYCSILLLAAGLPTVIHAQAQRSGDANARAMQQLQQLTNERAQLKADNDKLKQEVADLTKQLAAATSSQASLQQKLKSAESGAARDATSGQQNAEAAEKMRTQMQELVTRFRETAQSLKEIEADRNTLRGQSQTKERELTMCVERNLGLYQLNTEVLDRLENKGVFSTLAEKEPFTKIQRTRLENLIEGYKDRAADLHVEGKTP